MSTAETTNNSGDNRSYDEGLYNRYIINGDEYDVIYNASMAATVLTAVAVLIMFPLYLTGSSKKWQVGNGTYFMWTLVAWLRLAGAIVASVYALADMSSWDEDAISADTGASIADANGNTVPAGSEPSSD